MARALSSPADARGFGHVETWIFDLDNTLYPPSCRLFDLIDQRMTLYIANLLGIDAISARRLQKDYYRTYGTSLRGLMEVEGVDPHAFMDFVHDISHENLVPDPALIAAISALPGKRYVMTNGSRGHPSAAPRRSACPISFTTFSMSPRPISSRSPSRQPMTVSSTISA